MPEPTVREQQTKCKTLRARLVECVNTHPAGEWQLGCEVVTDCQYVLTNTLGIHTTGEVLAKELRKACRLGEIRKRIRPGTVYGEYTACAPAGELFDNSMKHHNQ